MGPVYRELVEWAILFSILREKDFGTDTIIVCDGLLRSKVYTSPRQVIAAAKRILNAVKTPREVPTGDFWRLAFRNTVLETLCRLREGLLASCESDTRKALRAVILGALHGPRTKQFPSYFSNQSPRTYSPKPGYAVKFWTDRNLVPPNVDALDIITRRAQRFFGEEFTTAEGSVVAGDSRMLRVFRHVREKIGWIVTSPPYYGMRTYIPDQWLRRWFLGGPTHVDYSSRKQLSHASQKKFCEGLKTVWTNCANVADPGCRLVIRFGAINDRKVSSLHLLKESLQGTEWRIQTCRRAGTATSGKRQAEQFVSAGAAIEEYDLWAALA